MADISILGCGWMGFPLAKELIRRGHSVKGSTTTAGKLPVMEASGIRAYLISTDNNCFSGDIASFLEADILIVTVPPGKGALDYPGVFASLFPYIQKAAIRKVLFTSSISVYGKTKGHVDETTQPTPDTSSAKAILEVETAFRAHFPETTVLRLGGLTGPGRHPVNSLAGRTNLPEGDAPINLVHLDDCIGIASAVISDGLWGRIYNVVPPFHPSKKDYYDRKAEQFGLPSPVFLDGGSDGRIVDGGKITSDCGYLYRVTDSI